MYKDDVMQRINDIDTCEDADLMGYVVQEKSQEAFAELVKRYRKKLFGTCYRMMGNIEEAEEAVQESFIKLWNYADRWDQSKAKMSTWLYTITSNTCLDALRKRRAIFVEHDENRESDDMAGPEIVEQKQTSDIVKKAIQKLPEDQRQALVLSYYQGLSQKEIAKIMGKTPKSVEGLVARARNDLKGRLKSVLG